MTDDQLRAELLAAHADVMRIRDEIIVIRNEMVQLRGAALLASSMMRRPTRPWWKIWESR